MNIRLEEEQANNAEKDGIIILILASKSLQLMMKKRG